MKERSSNDENLPLLTSKDRLRRWVEHPAPSELTFDSSGARDTSPTTSPEDDDIEINGGGGTTNRSNESSMIQIKEVVFHEEVEFNDDLDASPTGIPPKNRFGWMISKIDKGAFQFGVRMAVMLTFTSLFVLVRTQDYTYPAGMWVLVSTLFVCWFPALDAASVIEQIVQRLIGTFVGAVLGLSCGFLSLLFPNPVQQSIFIAVCMFVVNFLIVFLAGQCKVGRVKVIRRFAYATICK